MSMLESLRKIVQEANAAKNFSEVLSVIVHQVKKTMDTDVCSVYLHDPDSNSYVLMGTDGLNEKAIGKVDYPLVESEPRRCLIVIYDIKKGELLSIKNTKSLRPGGGIEPKYFDQIIDKYIAMKDIAKGTLLQWDMVKKN